MSFNIYPLSLQLIQCVFTWHSDSYKKSLKIPKSHQNP